MTFSASRNASSIATSYVYHLERVECADAETLAELVADALPEAERAAIATHAASCARCHAVLDGLLTTTGGSVTPASPDDVTRDDDAPATAKLSLRRGARIDRYVIEERIGAGGMGVVYAATDSELQRRVAIKLVRRGDQGAITTQGRERLMREARLLASLSHPNVVTVFDVGTHDGHVFIAMELVDSGSITGWIRDGNRSTAHARLGFYVAQRFGAENQSHERQDQAGKARDRTLHSRGQGHAE